MNYMLLVFFNYYYFLLKVGKGSCCIRKDAFWSFTVIIASRYQKL